MRSGMAVGKVARRLQVTPTMKTIKVVSRRPNAPGQHGQRKFGSKSVYALQLIEKQKLMFQFMLTEKALRRNYKSARSKKGRTGETLVQMLDERLDATIFRSGIVRSVLASRQLITHRHVFVNGLRVDKPSYRLKVGDSVTFSTKAAQFAFIVEGFRDAVGVNYIELDRQAGVIRRTATPPRESIPVQCDEQMVVEWYSR